MKKKKENKNQDQVNEPLAVYGNKLRFFHSFEEQEQAELEEMAALSSVEILQQLRRFINIAYGMHGYNPDVLPSKHNISNIKYV